MSSILKKIEFKIKKIIEKNIFEDRKTFSLKGANNVFLIKKKYKILILRHDKIGDLIISTSFIRILRQHNPTAQIDILLSKSNISAKTCIKKYIDNVHVYEKKIINSLRLISWLRKEKYDIIVDLFDNSSTTSAFLIKYIKPIFAIGIDKKNSHIYDYTVPMRNRFSSHIVERTANLLLPFGINPDNEDLHLEYDFDKKQTAKSGKFRFGINLAGGSKSRYWGKENNSELIEFLEYSFPDAEIRLFNTLEYKEDTDFLKHKHSKIITGICPSFDDFVAEIYECNFIISPDTSIVHIVSAFALPAVILYIRNENASHLPWYPFMGKYIALETMNNLSSISVESVTDAVFDLHTKINN